MTDTTPADVAADERMSAAAFRVAREYLGLTTAWLADHLDVRERTVHRWEAGDSPIPVRVGEALKVLEQDTTDYVAYAVEVLTAKADREFLTYRTDADYRAHHPDLPWPASWHRAVAARVAHEVPGLVINYWRPPCHFCDKPDADVIRGPDGLTACADCMTLDEPATDR